MQEAGRRCLAGDGAHTIEQIGLPCRAREGGSGVAPIADEAQMDLLAKGQARGHSVLQPTRDKASGHNTMRINPARHPTFANWPHCDVFAKVDR